MMLVGRESETAALDALLAAARGSRGGALVLDELFVGRLGEVEARTSSRSSTYAR